MGPPPSGPEFNSLLVGVDRRNVYDGPDPSHRAGKTERKKGNAELGHGFLGVASIKIVRSECTEKNAKNDEGHTVFGVGVRLERERGCRGGGRYGRDGLCTEED